MTPDVRPQAEAAAADRIPPAADQSRDLVPTLHLRIQPSHGWVALNLGELWQYRELLYFLVWRDVKVRYKQTALGASWAILQPFFTMLVFSLFFGRLAGIETPVPYPLFSFSGLVIWTFFANGLTQSSNSLVGSQNLITKVYFPRLTVPLATILSGVVDFALAFVVLIGLLLYYVSVGSVTLAVGWPLLLLPFPLLLAFVTALGAGLWLSALNVEYRDVRYVSTLPDTVLALRDADRLSEQPTAGGMARRLRPQPHGRGGRQLPVVPLRHGGARCDDPGLVASRRPPARHRFLLLPPHGADVRGCGVAVSDVMIHAQGVGKQYRIGEAQAPYKSLRESLVAGAKGLRPWRTRRDGRTADDVFWALKDVSFTVSRGEAVGIIGRNGAGKSTLLKVLSRITEPTAGTIDIYGRLGSLLEVGTGFHPELSGRENIYLSGAILGMKRIEIDRRFDEIVDFAEVERFIDTPVKRFSSGMYLRLAFAVAAHLEPEILLVDEVLAVGDAAFQKKCLGKMGDVAGQGRTVLFVSHNMPAILSFCSRVVLIKSGTTQADGMPAEIVDTYLRDVEGVASGDLAARQDRKGSQAVRFLAWRAQGTDGGHIRSGCGARIELDYEASDGSPIRQVEIALGIHGRLDEHLFHLSNRVSGRQFETLPPSGTLVCEMPQLALQPGSYTFNLFCTLSGVIADWVQNAGSFSVEPDDFFGSGCLPPAEQGPFLVAHSWSSVERFAP